MINGTYIQETNECDQDHILVPQWSLYAHNYHTVGNSYRWAYIDAICMFPKKLLNEFVDWHRRGLSLVCDSLICHLLNILRQKESK